MVIIGLVPFVGVVVFGVLFAIMVLKGGSLKIPTIGMAACFVLTVAIGALIFLGIGPFGDGMADDGSEPSNAAESQDVDESEAVEPEGQGANGETSDELSVEKIAHTEFIAKNGDMIIVFKNNNSSQIPDFEAEITFFDSNGDMVSVQTDGHDAVLPGSEVVSIEQTPEEYDHYEISIKLLNIGGKYENFSESLTIEDNMGENGVVARFTNNAEKEIEELEAVAVYYKDGEVVGADQEEEYHIASGDFVTVQFYAPYGTDYKIIEFDNYKIFINQAHNFNI